MANNCIKCENPQSSCVFCCEHVVCLTYFSQNEAVAANMDVLAGYTSDDEANKSAKCPPSKANQEVTYMQNVGRCSQLVLLELRFV